MNKQKTKLISKDIDKDLESITLAQLILQEKFIDPTIKLLGKIGLKVFSGANNLIYEIVVKMREEGEKIDSQTVKIRLRKEKIPDSDSIFALLFELTTESESLPWETMEKYLKGLKDLTTERGRKQEAGKYLLALNNGEDPVKAKEELDQGIADIETEIEKVKVGMNALESLTSPIEEKPCPIEGGLFAPERYTLFGASDGEGKTSLMAQLSFNAITGTPFLGVFNIPKPIDVLLISGENSRGDLNQKWKMALPEIEKIKGEEARKYLENLQVCYPSEVDVQLDKKGGTAWLEAQLKEYRPDLLILDSLCQVLSSETSLNDDITARRAGESLNRISRDFNCMVIITTHLRKPTETESKALSETKGGKMYDSIPGGISLLFHGSRYFTNLAVSKVAMYRKDRQKFETVKWIECKFKIAESPPTLLVERDRETLWCKETTPGQLNKLLPKDIVWILRDKNEGRAVPSIFVEVVMESLNCGKTQAKELIKLATDQGLIVKGKGIKDKGLLLSRLEDTGKRGKGGAGAGELGL